MEYAIITTPFREFCSTTTTLELVVQTWAKGLCFLCMCTCYTTNPLSSKQNVYIYTYVCICICLSEYLKIYLII